MLMLGGGLLFMTTAECEAIFDDLGLSKDQFGIPAREATAKYLQSLDSDLNDGQTEITALIFYKGYYQALQDNFLKIHNFLNIDITRQQGLPNPHRLMTK